MSFSKIMKFSPRDSENLYHGKFKWKQKKCSCGRKQCRRSKSWLRVGGVLINACYYIPM
jgi:hypothetical protein